MSRFAALDLTTLPDPTEIGVLDFDAILEARLVELESQLAEVFDAPKVADVMALARNIAASPIMPTAKPEHRQGSGHRLFTGKTAMSGLH